MDRYGDGGACSKRGQQLRLPLKTISKSVTINQRRRGCAKGPLTQIFVANFHWLCVRMVNGDSVLKDPCPFSSSSTNRVFKDNCYGEKAFQLCSIELWSPVTNCVLFGQGVPLSTIRAFRWDN